MAEPAALRRFTPASWEAEVASGDADRGYDLVVFDRVDDVALPGRPSVWFGGRPLGLDVRPPSSPGGRRLRALAQKSW